MTDTPPTPSNAPAALLFMDDCQVGQTFAGGPTTVTDRDIVAFAAQFDPQPFHLDAVAARDTAFGELVASGWHTAAMTMRMMLGSLPAMQGGMIGRRIESIDWPAPVRPGDTLTTRSEILHLRATGNPARGLMRLKTDTLNQHGAVVMTMEALIFVPRRADS